MLHAHIDQNELIVDILLQMAQENNKPLERIKHLILIKQNGALINRFWEILDQALPNHPYSYMGCCGECGALELCEELP